MARKKPAKKTATKKPATVTKPTKKAPSKTRATSTSQVQHQVVETPNDIAARPTAFRMKTSYIVLFVVVVAFAALLYAVKGYLVAAVVNGQPISRFSVISQTEKQSGKQALDTLVRDALIEQEAQKQKVSVSDKEIDDEVKKLENNLSKQGQKLEQVLQMQGMNREDLRKLIRLDKLVGKMVGKDIKISDKAVNDYISKNKDALPPGQSDAQLKTMVRDQLKQQELNTKVKTWLETLQKNAKINYFVKY